MSLDSALELKKKEGAHGVAEEVEVSGKTDTVEIEMTKMHQIDNRKELEAKFVRKLDLRLLPLMMLICEMFYHVQITIETPFEHSY